MVRYKFCKIIFLDFTKKYSRLFFYNDFQNSILKKVKEKSLLRSFCRMLCYFIIVLNLFCYFVILLSYKMTDIS
jgi:hypothetical protein